LLRTVDVLQNLDSSKFIPRYAILEMDREIQEKSHNTQHAR